MEVRARYSRSLQRPYVLSAAVRCACSSTGACAHINLFLLAVLVKIAAMKGCRV